MVASSLVCTMLGRLVAQRNWSGVQETLPDITSKGCFLEFIIVGWETGPWNFLSWEWYEQKNVSSHYVAQAVPKPLGSTHPSVSSSQIAETIIVNQYVQIEILIWPQYVGQGQGSLCNQLFWLFRNRILTTNTERWGRLKRSCIREICRTELWV